MDIDFFKNYNDKFGHPEGDKCLESVAQKIKNSIKSKTDFVARYGGEEFLIIIYNVNELQAIKIANRIRVGISDMKIPTAKKTISPYVTISIGVAMHKPNSKFDYYKLLKEADNQLYIVKNNDRNNVAINGNLLNK